MLLPDEENLPAWLRAEIAVLGAGLGPDPHVDALRAARRRLSPRARTYLRELAARAFVAEVALELLASGELPDCVLTGGDSTTDDGDPAPRDWPGGWG